MCLKYKCLGCGGFFSSKEIPVCPVCQSRGIKIKKVSEVSEKEAWVRVIAKCERFVERIKRT